MSTRTGTARSSPPRLKAENITWRSFWNGPQGTNGPISSRRNIKGWPMIDVIADQGVIRHRDLSGDELKAALDRLITVDEKRATAKSRGSD